MERNQAILVSHQGPQDFLTTPRTQEMEEALQIIHQKETIGIRNKIMVMLTQLQTLAVDQ
jgi:hypothetical protein